jgi:hypothetical protein
MNVTIFKVEFGGCWDCHINESVRNILKQNGFVLKKDESNIEYEHSYGSYPEGHDYSSWHKDRQSESFTYEQYPYWVPLAKNSKLLILNSEQFAELMFANTLLEENKIKFDKVGKTTMNIDHPFEGIMKEIGGVLSTCFGEAVIKNIMKQTKQ